MEELIRWTIPPVSKFGIPNISQQYLYLYLFLGSVSDLLYQVKTFISRACSIFLSFKYLNPILTHIYHPFPISIDKCQGEEKRKTRSKRNREALPYRYQRLYIHFLHAIIVAYHMLNQCRHFASSSNQIIVQTKKLSLLSLFHPSRAMLNSFRSYNSVETVVFNG